MKYEVHKCYDDEIEYLPDLVDTPIWKDFDVPCPPKSVRDVAMLYDALSDRENYYQFHSPTAFGDPQYSFAQGRVIGVLQGTGIEETAKQDRRVYRKGRKIVLVVDKIALRRSYYEERKELRETLAAIM